MRKSVKGTNIIFPRETRTSILVLLLLLILVITVWSILPKILKTDDSIIHESLALQSKWNEHKAQLDKNSELVIDDSFDSINSNLKIDPNTASIDEMIQIGIPKGIALTIEKFRAKGGSFKHVNDLRKIYTISPGLLEKIKDNITIVQHYQEHFPEHHQQEKYKTAISDNRLSSINLNTADEAALMQIRGIGKGYAKRILDRRNRLGGFYSIAQLKEIYNFPDSVIAILEPLAIINTKEMKRININTTTEEELASHPYIGKQLAQNIIRLRTDLKSFNEISDLKQTPLINEEKYRKIAHYIYIE